MNVLNLVRNELLVELGEQQRNPPPCPRTSDRNCYVPATEVADGTNRETCLAAEHPDGTWARSVNRPKNAEVVSPSERREHEPRASRGDCSMPGVEFREI